MKRSPIAPSPRAREKVIINVDDILANPALLSGKTPDEIQEMLGETPGWNIEPLARGSKKGQGWLDFIHFSKLLDEQPWQVCRQ